MAITDVIINVGTQAAPPGQRELTEPPAMDHLARESETRDIPNPQTMIKKMSQDHD